MSGRTRSEQFVLKHRLTGAAVLIGFAVIVLPLLLGGPEGDGAGQGAGAADKSPTTVFHSSITPIGGATPNARLSREARNGDTAKSGETASAVERDGAARQDTRTASAGQVETSSGKTAGAEPGRSVAGDSSSPSRSGGSSGDKADSSAAGTGSKKVERGWVVQVGVFKDPENVKKLVAKLHGSGIESSTSDVDTSDGKATRVWVGPFETRVEAARTKVRIKQHTGSQGLIVAYP